MKLVNTGRRLDSRVHHHGYDEIDPLNAGLLNRILKAVGNEDALNIARYARFDRPLAHIWLRKDLSYGWVVYEGSSGERGPSEDYGTVSKPFNVVKTDRGRLDHLQQTYWVYDSPLQKLKRKHLQLILISAATVDHDITLDLDRHTACGLDFGALQSNQQLRRSAYHYGRSLNQVTIHMATTDLQGSY
jgi:hypothetical protein